MTEAVDWLENKSDVNHTTQVCQIGADKVSSDVEENRSTFPSRSGTVLTKV